MNHFQFKVEERLVGTLESVNTDTETCRVRMSEILTSDAPRFYRMIRQMSSKYCNFPHNDISNFLAIIHNDLNVDTYTDFLYDIQCRLQGVPGDYHEGDPILHSDIVGISGWSLPECIDIRENDSVVCCIKVNWKFILYYHFYHNDHPFILSQMLNLIRSEYERLSFEDEFSIPPLVDIASHYTDVTLPLDESRRSLELNEIISEGWFNFRSLTTDERNYIIKYDGFKNLSEEWIISTFNNKRIDEITNKWWNDQFFRKQRKMIEAGIDHFLQHNFKGYTACIQGLFSIIDGVLRHLYLHKTSKQKHIKSSAIIDNLREVTSDDDTLLFRDEFNKYLREFIYAPFDISDHIPFSRNSVSHGVLPAEEYTIVRCLQEILTLDQIYLSIRGQFLGETE